jgi:catechol-2,3-dioxygenase
MKAVKLNKIGHVLIAVSDMERSKDFYINTLGFSILEEDMDHGGVFLTGGAGTHLIDLVPGPRGDTAAAPATISDVKPKLGFGHLAFLVDSADALRAAHHELCEKGVTILAAIDHESQLSIYFSDPDGNMLEIYWERPDALEIFRRGRKDQDRPIDFSGSTWAPAA